EAYVDGRAMPTGNPRKGFTQTIKQIAQKYGADIGLPADDTTFGARSTMRKNLSTAAPNSLGGPNNNEQNPDRPHRGLEQEGARPRQCQLWRTVSLARDQ